MHRIRLLKDRFSIRSVRHIYQRFFAIYSRYGLNASRFSKTLNEFIGLLNHFQIKATLPVTALVFKKNYSLFKTISSKAEFAVHGLRHVDYTYLDHEVIGRHLESSSRIFNHFGIWNFGFRFPYLGRNNKLIRMISEFGFDWDSSEVIDYGILKKNFSHSKQWNGYQRLITHYNAKPVHSTPGIPYTKEGILEIPVALPDDDILVDHFRCSNSEIFNKWMQMMQIARERHSHLNLQIHPERFLLYQKALSEFLGTITKHTDIWIASLNQIAEWYQERKKSQIQIQKLSRTRYRVHFSVSPRTQILIRNLKNKSKDLSIWKSIEVAGNNIELHSEKQPIIGVHPETSKSILSFLNDEGLPYIVSDNKESCSFYIKDRSIISENKKMILLEKIEKIKTPLIRLWRWPRGYRCALSLTGDIDCVSFWDFFTRFYE